MAFPVTTTGSRILLSRKQWVLSLHVPKARYPFASFALSKFQEVQERSLVPNGYTSEGIVSISGFQASTKERFIIGSRGNEEKPPLVGLKETAMVFLQCQDEPVYQLVTKELGVAVLIINHGLLQDHCTGIPYVDLSVCILKHETLGEVVPLWMKFVPTKGIRSINCSPSEIELFKLFGGALWQQVLYIKRL